MPMLVTDLECAKIQLECHREKKTTNLFLWVQHKVHWLPVLAWWGSAFCHPYVALNVVVVVHEVYCVSSTSSTSFHIGLQVKSLNQGYIFRISDMKNRG